MLRTYTSHLLHLFKGNNGEKVPEPLRQCQSTIFPTDGARRTGGRLYQASSPGRRSKSRTADPVGTASPKPDGGGARPPTNRPPSTSGRRANTSLSPQPSTLVRSEIEKAHFPFSFPSMSDGTATRSWSRETTAILFLGSVLHLRQLPVGSPTSTERI